MSGRHRARLSGDTIPDEEEVQVGGVTTVDDGSVYFTHSYQVSEVQLRSTAIMPRHRVEAIDGYIDNLGTASQTFPAAAAAGDRPNRDIINEGDHIPGWDRGTIKMALLTYLALNTCSEKQDFDLIRLPSGNPWFTVSANKIVKRIRREGTLRQWARAHADQFFVWARDNHLEIPRATDMGISAAYSYCATDFFDFLLPSLVTDRKEMRAIRKSKRYSLREMRTQERHEARLETLYDSHPDQE